MKNLKKLLVCLLVFAMTLSVVVLPVAADTPDPAPVPPAPWDGSVDTAWYNTEDTEFLLTTPAQLAGLAYIVNGVNPEKYDGFYGKTVKLGADIVFNSGTFAWTDSSASSNPGTLTYDGEALTYTSTDDTTKIAKWSTASGKVVYAWNPIGNLAGNSNIENVYNGVIVKPGVFFGSFDGQGHTVSGMYINTNTEANTDCYKGFFGTFAGAAITNLRIVNAFTRGAGRNGTVAGMVYGMIPKDRAEDDWASYVAKGQYTDISFIYAEGIVTSYHTAGGQRYAGGLFGGVRAYDKKNDPHLSAEEQVGVVGSVIYIRNAEFSGTVDVGITQLADNSWPQYACAIAGWIAGYENTATDGNMFDIIFENVYAHANLLARFFVGAVGYAYRTDYEFINCVSTLTANVASNDYVGAFVAKGEFPTGDANVKFQGKLIIKNSYYIPFDPDGQNFFRTPEGVKASEAAKAITVNPETDLSGATKVTELTEIAGLDRAIWGVNENEVILSSVYFENPDDPTSTPIVPQPASEEPGEPGGDQPGEQPGEQPGTDPDPVEDNTTTPEPTPTVEPGAITTDATKGKKKGGCRSVVSAGTGVVVFVALFGIAITRKKED